MLERRREMPGMAGNVSAGTTIQTTQKSSSSLGVTTRKQSLAYILSFVALFMLVALCDWENYTSSTTNGGNTNFGSAFREDSMRIINDLEGVKSEKLSERLEELREEKKKIEEEIKKTTNDNEEETEEEEEEEEDGMTSTKRKKEYDENNFPEAIIENIERDLGHGRERTEDRKNRRGRWSWRG